MILSSPTRTSLMRSRTARWRSEMSRSFAAERIRMRNVVNASARRLFAPTPIQGLPRYYGLLRPCATLFHLPIGTKAARVLWLLANVRSLGSRTRSVCTCQGLRLRRAGWVLALASPSMLPSTVSKGVGTQDEVFFRGSIAWPMRSLVDASRLASRLGSRMTRGRYGSVLLHRLPVSRRTDTRPHDGLAGNDRRQLAETRPADGQSNIIPTNQSILLVSDVRLGQ
jgi:hypothetical protein